VIDPVALLKEYHAALNAFDLKKVEGMFAEDAVYISPGLNGEVRGRIAILNAMRNYFAEYADQISTDESITLSSAFSAEAVWSSSASKGKVRRHGIEKIMFNSSGLIQHVNVLDQS
jgi:Domain of unknown function (DUF4440)